MNCKVLSKKDIHINKGNRFVPWTHNPKNDSICLNQKVVVFDLDETLGSFADLYILWCGVSQIWPTCQYFDLLLDVYPEFFRYGMLTILEYLYDCKQKGKCHKIFVYTNNQCSVTWVKQICNYMESRVIRNYFEQSSSKDNSMKLFDQHICAFKINNKPVELCRTSHQKRLDDFFRCSTISENADICFIDDVDYPYMRGSAVYYICPRAYIHPLSTREIINRILKSTWITEPDYSILLSKSYWQNWFFIHRKRMIRKGVIDLSIDLQISQKLIYHLSEFLHCKTWNTEPILKKIRSERKRFSRRRVKDNKSTHNVTVKKGRK